MTKLCNTCEYLKFCARSGIEEVGCDRYKRDTTTNEEWFCGLSTEEKAKWLSNNSQFMYACGHQQAIPKTMYEEDWEWWLKQPHTNE